MSNLQRIAELENEIRQQRQSARASHARAEALQVELRTLLAGTAPPPPGPSTPRTDAILAVLRSTDYSMSPTEIRDALIAAGRDDELRSITATLHHLIATDKVNRPGRGRYTAN